MAYLPIIHRKAIIDFCRIQAPILSNKTLSQTFKSLKLEELPPLICTHTVVAAPPSWWFDVFVPMYPELIPEDPSNVQERVSSILGSE